MRDSRQGGSESQGCYLMKFRYLDEYDFRARFVPSIFITLPALFAAFSLLPSLRSFIGLIAGPTIETVLVLVLVRIARDQGKKIEPQLVREWDGLPTTRHLRHRNGEVEPLTRDRYKMSLSKLTGLKFPTAAQETANPADADAAYTSAIATLREHRRGKKYPLVFNENCNYGMMRNLLGLRPIGITISIICAIAVSGGLLLPTTSPDLAALTLVVCGLLVVVLLGFTTRAAVKRTAEAYANALLATCLTASPSTKK
jgi:hypothetical protein